jgi:hypothetical protein
MIVLDGWFLVSMGRTVISGMLLQTAVFWKFYDFVEGQGFILEIHVLVINALLFPFNCFSDQGNVDTFLFRSLRVTFSINRNAMSYFSLFIK